MKKTLGELVDELTIVNVKMSRWNHEKLDLYEKLKETYSGLVLPEVIAEEKNKIKQQIIELDKKVMITNEKRAELKNALNELFGQSQEQRTYQV